MKQVLRSCVLSLVAVSLFGHAPSRPQKLDNAQVEHMLAAGVPPSAVYAKVINAGAACALDSSPDALAKLAKDKVPELVIDAIAGSNCKQPPNPPRPKPPTYQNSNGQQVPRPEAAPAPPAGASAQCRDGTYSFSQHRRGTCSHHGGVARWLGGEVGKLGAV